MTVEEFRLKMFGALATDVTPKIQRLPHVRDERIFKVIREIISIKIVDFIAPEFEIFNPHMVLEFRFKVALDFVYFTGSTKDLKKEQQTSISKESFGTCRYNAEQEWFVFDYERVVF